MPKGGRGGRRSGGLPFKMEGEAEVYAKQELRKAGVNPTLRNVPEHGITSKAAKHAFLDAETSGYNGKVSVRGNISKKTAKNALKIAQNARLKIHSRFLGRNGDFNEYKKALKGNDRVQEFFKSKL